MIKAVIFDMDGTLVDSEPTWGQTFNKVFKKIGIELTETDHIEMRGRSAISNIERLYSEKPWKGPKPGEVYDQIIKGMVEAIDAGVVLLPGVHEALALFKKRGLPIAIASGSPMMIIDAVVDAVEIREHFHHLYSAQYEPYGKPHPGIFIKVAGHFKVKPSECLVFEDSPSGVLAAKAAQMRCVAIPTTPQTKGNPFIQTADAILDSLSQFDESLLKKF
jgi:HAD superfamily hydrolase (TIGR01509 family)